ncbi:C2H2-type zinc finger protein [Aspergillus puulaauensis]|uniref:C2H2-type domain-containing protein n=1 Tax=Aspergillus puulaauensis TaxID=1220207 RepID=A0A7R7XB98_9EURO|nr:uncharacterized protein APUU_11090S [Aspergillus puulaauensis]BCS18262.1 hypothetical protein APUU_11090S [Aspergillus puulaauensis]
MDPPSSYNVADINNNDTTNFMAMWQDTIEPQSHPLHFNLPEEMFFWNDIPLTNNGLAGSMMPGPAHGTNPPVIDLTESTPEPSQSPSGTYLGRLYTDSSSFSPESSLLLRQGETPSTVVEDNRLFEPQRSTRSITRTNSHSSNSTPSSSRLYKCEWRDCHTPGHFHRELDLVRHLRTVHISPDKYPCDGCDKTFGRKDHLNGHRKKHHGSARSSASA